VLHRRQRILTPPSSAPTPSRLEATTLELNRAGDLRAVICLVESWALQGEPTTNARLAQVDALATLGMMDRAWVRLQPMVDNPGANVEVLALGARLLISRGWPGRARKLLDRGFALRPGDSTLSELWDKAAAPATEAEEIDNPEGADDQTLLGRAHFYIARGSFLKGKLFLERILKRTPDHRRAADMLWAMKGDYGLEPSVTLADVAARHGPDLATLADFSDEAEHTEASPRGLVDLEPVGMGFPVLFRAQSNPGVTPAGESTEVTAITSMAEVQDMRRAAEEHTETGREVTSVRHVIRHDTEVERDEVETAFDLSEFRAEMSLDYPDADVFAEREDDDVIILTRREDTDFGDPATTDVSGRVDLGPDLPTDVVGTLDEAAAWASPSDFKEAETVLIPTPDDLRPHKRRLWPWWLAAMGIVVGFGFAVIAITILISLL